MFASSPASVSMGAASSKQRSQAPGATHALGYSSANLTVASAPASPKRLEVKSVSQYTHTLHIFRSLMARDLSASRFTSAKTSASRFAWQRVARSAWLWDHRCSHHSLCSAVRGTPYCGCALQLSPSKTMDACEIFESLLRFLRWPGCNC